MGRPELSSGDGGPEAEPVSLPGPVSKHVFAVGPAEVPVYIVAGADAVALVDGGIGPAGPLYGAGLLESVGRAPRAGDRVLLTHSHVDHVGAVPYLKRRFPELEVAASAHAREVLARPDVLERIGATNEALALAYGAGELFPGEDLSFARFEIGRTLAEGAAVDLGGGVRIRVLEAPGHTRCSIAFLVEPDATLLAGDAAGYCAGDGEGGLEGGIVPEGCSGYGAYCASIERFASLDLAAIGLGHFVAFRGRAAVRSFLERSLRAAGKLRAEVERHLARGGASTDEIAASLGDSLFRGKLTVQPRPVFDGNLRRMVDAIAREAR